MYSTTHASADAYGAPVWPGLMYGLQDVLKYYKATVYGSGPPALGCRSPRESYDPRADYFMRERGSYQDPMEHP